VNNVLISRGSREPLRHRQEQHGVWSVSACAARLSRRSEMWLLTRLRQLLVKAGGRMVEHARSYRLMLAEIR
jgi:hypothetical protein